MTNAEIDKKKIDTWYKQGKFLLSEGRITAAHMVFAQIAQIDKVYPDIGHALAVSIPNSFLIKLKGKFDKDNIVDVYEMIKQDVLTLPRIKYLIFDLEGYRALPHYAIRLFVKLSEKPNISVKILQLDPKPKQILKNLKRDDLIWSETTCPVCGPETFCIAQFSKRNRYIIDMDAIR